jgi:hypothetical protein
MQKSPRRFSTPGLAALIEIEQRRGLFDAIFVRSLYSKLCFRDKAKAVKHPQFNH